MLFVLFLLQKQIPTSSALSIINARNALTSDQCDNLDNSEIFIHLVEMGDTGFLGVYSPDSSQVHSLFSGCQQVSKLAKLDFEDCESGCSIFAHTLWLYACQLAEPCKHLVELLRNNCFTKYFCVKLLKKNVYYVFVSLQQISCCCYFLQRVVQEMG